MSVHRMEIERIRYVLSSYLRCRLVKVRLAVLHRVGEKGSLQESFLLLLQ